MSAGNCRGPDRVLATLQAAAKMPASELAERLVRGDGELLVSPPKRTSTSIRFPTALHVALTRAAEERGLSVNFLVIAAVREFLERLIPAEEVR